MHRVLSEGEIFKSPKLVIPPVTVAKSGAYTARIHRAPDPELSFLISDKSREIADVVSYVPVLDRLTCGSLMPEADSLIDKSEEATSLIRGSTSMSSMKLKLPSKVISKMIPTTMSYVDLSKFMASPQFRARIRGCSPSFEKLMVRLLPLMEKGGRGRFDLAAFLRRDEELLHEREILARGRAPDIRLNASPRSLKLAQFAAIRRAKAKVSAAEMEKVKAPEAPSRNDDFRLARTSELTAIVKRCQHVLRVADRDAKVRDNEDKEMARTTKLTRRNLRLAERSAQRHRNAPPPPPPEEPPRYIRHVHKKPSFMSKIVTRDRTTEHP